MRIIAVLGMRSDGGATRATDRFATAMHPRAARVLRDRSRGRSIDRSITDGWPLDRLAEFQSVQFVARFTPLPCYEMRREIRRKALKVAVASGRARGREIVALVRLAPAAVTRRSIPVIMG